MVDEHFVKYLESEETIFREFDCQLSRFSYQCSKNYDLLKNVSVSNQITFNRASGTVSQRIFVSPSKFIHPSTIYEGKCEISDKAKF